MQRDRDVNEYSEAFKANMVVVDEGHLASHPRVAFCLLSRAVAMNALRLSPMTSAPATSRYPRCRAGRAPVRSGTRSSPHEQRTRLARGRALHVVTALRRRGCKPCVDGARQRRIGLRQRHDAAVGATRRRQVAREARKAGPRPWAERPPSARGSPRCRGGSRRQRRCMRQRE